MMPAEPTTQTGGTMEITPFRGDPVPKSDSSRVSVFLLRPFELAIDETPIEKWTSQKEKTVLKVLLLTCGRSSIAIPPLRKSAPTLRQTAWFRSGNL